jgi:cell division protein FtsQ
MLRRIKWKLVFKCFGWVLCLSGLVVLMSFIGIRKKDLLCNDIKVLIPGADNFIEREEIDAILKQGQGSLIGRRLNNINFEKIERTIKSNPFIAFAKVYADMDGTVHIEIQQRQPILRVVNASDQDFYIDKNGLKMPVSSNFTANVLVANGRILEHFSGKVDTLITATAKDLYKTALYIKQDSLWEAQIEQMFVNEKNDIELIPRVGNQRIILGTADSLDVKMRNLLAFYKQAMPKVGWDTYKTINIKYTNQIVCEKAKIDSLSSGTKATGSANDKTREIMQDSLIKDTSGKTNNNKLNKSI